MTKEEENINEEDGFRDIFRKRLIALGQWVKPNPADHLLIKILKLIYKSIVLLILVALSPVILLILIIIFFATL